MHYVFTTVRANYAPPPRPLGVDRFSGQTGLLLSVAAPPDCCGAVLMANVVKRKRGTHVFFTSDVGGERASVKTGRLLATYCCCCGYLESREPVACAGRLFALLTLLIGGVLLDHRDVFFEQVPDLLV